MRPSQRATNQLRPITFTRQYTQYAEGSVLVEFGQTRVLCTASVNNESIPRFLKGRGKGWITAEYSMLPRATSTRTDREAARGKQSGRTQEIQRLIGRALRAMVNLHMLGERMIQIDCDVIQADGGTRTAAISGSCVALYDAITWLLDKSFIQRSPILQLVAGVSVGIYKNTPILDLDYAEDSEAQTDLNLVMNEKGKFIELQGTAEGVAFTPIQLQAMLELGQSGIENIIKQQKAALGITG